MRFREWLRLARAGEVVQRALASALVVGPVLIVINHGSTLWQGDVDQGIVLRIGLTMIVPYLVSTHASVQAIRTARVAEGGLN